MSTRRRRKHTPEQIVRKLQDAVRMLAEGEDVAAVCRHLEVSEQTYYRRRNPFIESFNGRLRDECLNINELWSLTQARMIITDWKHQYNHHRAHSALGYQAPAIYAAQCTHRK
ncbi:MAG: integrase core domain-containing protein [Actinomycetia bacterium]|nr:integrase core domain-containing protein [Actinomycetes bacterium]MCH9800118.1 integrase core domain-containing protein [Actinomycetes bacterium]